MSETAQNLPAVPGARLPVTYETAQKALAECSRVDECKDWSDKAAALASYARQANDTTLHHLALRIQARAQRRMGELLKQIPSGQGANLSAAGRAAADPICRESATRDAAQQRPPAAVPPVTRTEVAREAGLSERQRKTALRIASVPEPDFTAAVESREPPTVTTLARMGTSGKPPAPEPQVQPVDPATASRALGLLRELAAFCGAHDPAAVALACRDPDGVRGNIEVIDRWLDRFITRLPNSQEDAP